MAIEVANDTPIRVKVTWVDAAGHETTVDGPTTWSSSDDTKVTAVVDPTDSTIATLTGVGAPGSIAQISARADAERDEGIREVVAMTDVTVLAGEAVAGTIGPAPSP